MNTEISTKQFAVLDPRFLTRYIEGLERLDAARLPAQEFALSSLILKCSWGMGRIKAVIPSLNYFTLGTGIAEPHVCIALARVVEKRVIVCDAPEKLYWLNPMFEDWKLKRRKLTRKPNLPMVFEQLRMEYDKWVKQRGPLLDALLESFIDSADGFLFDSVRNALCGDRLRTEPPAYSERPPASPGHGPAAVSKMEEVEVHAATLPDGSQWIPAAVPTHLFAGERPKIAEAFPSAQLQTAKPTRDVPTPLKKSDAAWRWLAEVDANGAIPKLGDPNVAAQWQETCLKYPDYVMGYLAGTWRRRSQRPDVPAQPLRYLSRVALNDKKLTPLKQLPNQ